MFQQKLFGNLQFIGELYRRKILSQNIIDSVFESLLEIDSNSDNKINDLVVEGAINLMNKAGQQYEQNIEATKKEAEKAAKQDKFEKICGRFK